MKTSKPTILITGSNGQLGQEFVFLLQKFEDWEVIKTDRDELDVTNFSDVDRFFKENSRINYILNCAAYTGVDNAETDVEVAHSVNMNGAKNIAKGAKDVGAYLFHFSTDYVYHNEHNTPFKEGDLTTPKSVYASTKLAGDNFIQRVYPLAMIIRTSWVYSSFGHNFVKTMLKLGKSKKELNVVFDQIGTPTYGRDLAQAVLDIVMGIETKKIDPNTTAGIFHYSNEGVTSWYDFAIAIFEYEGINCKVHPIESKDYYTPARRPPFSVLNKTKIKNAFSLEIPHWHSSLKLCLDNIKVKVIKNI